MDAECGAGEGVGAEERWSLLFLAGMVMVLTEARGV